MTDIRNDLHASVDESLDAAEKERQQEAERASLESRISAVENRPGPDLEPLHSGLAELRDTVTNMPEVFIERLQGLLGTQVQAGTETATNTDTNDDTEEAPKVVSQVVTKAEIEERAPRPTHLLFRRPKIFGG